MSQEEKKNRTLGIVISSVFHVGILLLLFAFTMGSEEEKEEPVMLIMDFSAGSSSKGGSSAQETPTEAVDEPTPVNKVDPVVTQETKSPVTKSNKKRSESSSKSTTPERKPNSSALANGAFSGNGTGKTDGDGTGNNDGIGDGVNGPGVTGKIGKLGTGTGTPPDVTNPTRDQQGKVVIEITVNRKGEVVNVKVLPDHPNATTTDPVLQAQARKDGYRFEFKPDSRRAELSKGLRVINYKLR